MVMGSLAESWKAFGVARRIARCILGIVMASVCLHCLCAMWVDTSSAILGNVIVKVHEWCLVCYRWLALCLRNNFHLAYRFSCLVRIVSPCQTDGFCVAYLSYGIVLVDHSCFRLVSFHGIGRTMKQSFWSTVLMHALMLWPIERCLESWIWKTMWARGLMDPCFALI
jgi:hypothetical protein